MSLDCLGLVASKLDFEDVWHLALCSGLMKTRMSRAVRDFRVDFSRRTFLPIAEIIESFNRFCTSPRSFDLRVGLDDEVWMLGDAIPWDLFPRDLRHLFLPLDVDAGTLSLRESLPYLESLCTGTITSNPALNWLPTTLTSFEIVPGFNDFKMTSLLPTLASLPPSLTRLVISRSLTVPFGEPSPCFKHMTGLEYVQF